MLYIKLAEIIYLKIRKENVISKFEFWKIPCYLTIFHKYVLNVNISLTPVWISMKSLPVGHNTHREGIVSDF